MDFLRQLGKSKAEKRQEALTAYLDGQLSPGDRRRFEQQLRSDAALRSELERQSQLKASISRLPRRRAPRNFILDPALYGRPQADVAFRLYPALRAATALASFFFIIALAAGLVTSGVSHGITSTASEPAGELAMDVIEEKAADEAPQVMAAPAEAVMVQPEEVIVEAEEVQEVAVEEAMAEDSARTAPEFLEQPQAAEPGAEGEAVPEETAAEAALEALPPSQAAGGGGLPPVMMTASALATEAVVSPTVTVSPTQSRTPEPTVTAPATTVDGYASGETLQQEESGQPAGSETAASRSSLSTLLLLTVIGLGALVLVLATATLLLRIR